VAEAFRSAPALCELFVTGNTRSAEEFSARRTIRDGGLTLQRHQIREQIGHLLILQSIEQPFGHQGATDELGAADVGFIERRSGRPGWRMMVACFVFADEEGVDEVAVFHFDAVDAVAGLHGGVGREDVAQARPPGPSRPRREVRADLAAGVADLMAGHADGAEGFAIGCIAFRSEGGVFAKLGVERLRLLRGEQAAGCRWFWRGVRLCPVFCSVRQIRLVLVARCGQSLREFPAGYVRSSTRGTR
jgi:hypothetical protein